MKSLTALLAVTLGLLFPTVGALMVGGGSGRTSVVLAVPATRRRPH